VLSELSVPDGAGADEVEPDDVEPDDAESDEPVLRLNRGGPESESEESLELDPELRGRGGAIVAESPGVISALGVPSSELATARRILGGPSVSLEELLEEGETFDELLDDELPVSPELDARRNRGRSGSSSVESEELEEDDRDDAELLLMSSEFDDRRNTGRLGLLDDEPADEELDEADEPDEEELGAELLADVLDEFDALSGLGSGFVGSSAASDAAECSSAVPSLTSVIV
jgi:hypothetical protein